MDMKEISDLPMVTIIVPCRNEEEFIGQCLDSILDNDYPAEKLEILVVDGMSEDRTRSIVRGYTEEGRNVKLLDNVRGIIPSAMNTGILRSKGSIIMKVDAHSAYPKEYIARCVTNLITSGAGNVGGVVKAIPRSDTVIGRAIVHSLSSRFGIGNSAFRIGSKEARFSDTAYSGCYQKKIFHEIGLYDENIERSEDVSINSRILGSGRKILLLPDLVITYSARSTMKDFLKHNYDNGYWVTYPLKFGLRLFSTRHLVPLFFVVGLLLAIVTVSMPSFHGGLKSILLGGFGFIFGTYIFLGLLFSAQVAFREREPTMVLIMPLIYASLHLSYGAGSLYGLAEVLFHGSGTRKIEAA
ncbi:MAG TPA: glycosyltransferase family 2 protein [Syntrophorhabdaceae bacterium]